MTSPSLFLALMLWRNKCADGGLSAKEYRRRLAQLASDHTSIALVRPPPQVPPRRAIVRAAEADEALRTDSEITVNEGQDTASWDDSSDSDIVCGDSKMTAQDLGTQPAMPARVAPMASAAPAVVEYAPASHVVAEPTPASVPLEWYEYPDMIVRMHVARKGLYSSLTHSNAARLMDRCRTQADCATSGSVDLGVELWKQRLGRHGTPRVSSFVR